MNNVEGWMVHILAATLFVCYIFLLLPTPSLFISLLAIALAGIVSLGWCLAFSLLEIKEKHTSK